MPCALRLSKIPNGSVVPSEVRLRNLQDARDGRRYATTTIGTQTWFRDLAYPLDGSRCCGDLASVRRIEDACTTGPRLPWSRLLRKGVALALGLRLVVVAGSRGWVAAIGRARPLRGPPRLAGPRRWP